jgi:hypothetical protein
MPIASNHRASLHKSGTSARPARTTKVSFLGLALTALLSLAACQGEIGGPAGPSGPRGQDPTGSGAGGSNPVGGTGVGSGTGSNPVGGTGSGTTGTGGSTNPPMNCMTTQAPALHARLLSPTQYNNTVQDLLKVGGNPAKDFGGGVDVQLDDLGAERRANAAAEVARQAALTLATWSPCVPPAVAAAACEQQLIDRIGPFAFRHPISTAERMQLQTLFDAGVREKDFATGVEWFLTGVLQSPDFLYQVSRLTPGEQPGQIRQLPAYELASRLAFFIWDSMPDDKLFAAAAANELADIPMLRTHLDRMLGDARFQRGMTGFYTSWLQLDGLREVARNDAGFTTEVVNALRTSLLMSATQLYATAAPNVSSLFAGQTYYLNDTLRTFYGLAGSGTAFAPTTISGQDRRGVLTHPGLLAMMARPDQTNPIARGLFVRHALMCQEIPSPPDNFPIPPLAPVTGGVTTRERLEQHKTVPLCMACHNQFDPPGYSFESFDEVGRHRTLDSGRPIDSSGTIVDGGDLDGPFAKGDQLHQRIATSQSVKGCFAQKYFEYAVARHSEVDDACSVDALKRSFLPSGDLKELVASVASTDSFRYRKSEGAP